MCYLMAKKFKEEGCIAFQTTPGKQMADFIEKIQNEVSDDVHILSLSRLLHMENMNHILLYIPIKNSNQELSNCKA